MSAEMRKSPKPTTLKSLDFAHSIRAAKSFLKTRIYQEGIGEQVVELYSEFFALWCKSIAFPELALPQVVMLKRWLKDAKSKNKGNKNGKVNSSVETLIHKLDSNAKWIEQKRLKVDYAPNNRAGVEKFLEDTLWENTPLGAYVVSQRKLREEKEKLLEAARKDRQEEEEEDEDDEHGVDMANGLDDSDVPVEGESDSD